MARSQGMLDASQQAVDRQGQGRGRKRASKDYRAVDHRQTAEDVLSEAAGANGRRDGGRADAHHRSYPDTGDDGREGERQFDHPQQLPWCHAHRDAGVDDRSIQAP